MAMHAAKGLEFDHVYVLGLMAARMPGPRRRALEPIPDALIKEAVPPDSKATHAAEMRRLLHVAMTRARRRLVLAFPEHSERGALQQPSPFAEEARARGRRRVGGEATRSCSGPPRRCSRRSGSCATSCSRPSPRSAAGSASCASTPTSTSRTPSSATSSCSSSPPCWSAPAPASRRSATLLPEINARLLQAVTAEQREIFETSALDEYLLDAERDEKLRARAVAQRVRAVAGVVPAAPRRGPRAERLRHRDLPHVPAQVQVRARLPDPERADDQPALRDPRPPGARALPRGRARPACPTLLNLLDAGWRRGGFGDSEEERQFRAKATQALVRYHDRFRDEDAEPVWFERSFQFRIGPHLLRGRVDRVDKLPEGGYELIDYKTGRPEDARRSCATTSSSRCTRSARARRGSSRPPSRPTTTCSTTPRCRCRAPRRIATGSPRPCSRSPTASSAQGFEPTPSFAACSMCDYRIACPAAER